MRDRLAALQQGRLLFPPWSLQAQRYRHAGVHLPHPEQPCLQRILTPWRLQEDFYLLHVHQRRFCYQPHEAKSLLL